MALSNRTERDRIAHAYELRSYGREPNGLKGDYPVPGLRRNPVG